MIPVSRTHEHGMNAGVITAIVLLTIGVIGMTGLAVWSFVNYRDQKSNVDAKIASAVAEAEKTQADKDEAKFAEREKDPSRTFAGPADYGQLSFSYPKTWSVYVASDVTEGGDFEAYLNPISVPPVDNKQRFALRVTILEKEYNEVIDDYSNLVEDGDLRSHSFSANGQNGTRLDGNFSDDIRGAAVLFKIRDKTAVIQTDADTFKADFEKIIKTISFSQ